MNRLAMNHSVKHDNGNRNRRGFTYAEVAVAAVLVSVVMVSALHTVGAAARTYNCNQDAMEGRAYAAEMLAEIMAQAYCDPEENDPDGNFGIEAGEPSPPPNRLGFDDIDDYDGWIESSALATRAGAARMDAAGWGRSVVVEKLKKRKTTDTHDDDNHKDDDARLITVKVTSPSGDTTVLRGIRSTFGAVEQAVGVDTTVVTGVDVSITLTDGETFVDTVPLHNHASGP